MLTKEMLQKKTVTELQPMARDLKVKNWWTLKKADLIDSILKEEIVEEEIVEEETPISTPTDLEEEIVTLKEIIEEVGVRGAKARRLLRESEIHRPFKRWEWLKDTHSKEIEEVYKLLSQ